MRQLLRDRNHKLIIYLLHRNKIFNQSAHDEQLRKCLEQGFKVPKKKKEMQDFSDLKIDPQNFKEIYEKPEQKELQTVLNMVETRWPETKSKATGKTRWCSVVRRGAVLCGAVRCGALLSFGFVYFISFYFTGMPKTCKSLALWVWLESMRNPTRNNKSIAWNLPKRCYNDFVLVFRPKLSW